MLFTQALWQSLIWSSHPWSNGQWIIEDVHTATHHIMAFGAWEINMYEYYDDLKWVFRAIERGEWYSESCQKVLEEIIDMMQTKQLHEVTLHKAIQELFWIENNEHSHEVWEQAINTVYIFLNFTFAYRAREIYKQEIQNVKNHQRREDMQYLTWGLVNNIFTHKEIQKLWEIHKIHGVIITHYIQEYGVIKFKEYIDAMREQYNKWISKIYTIWWEHLNTLQ